MKLPPNVNRNKEIDLLRAVAICLTVWCHADFWFPYPVQVPYSLNTAWCGVWLFFVVSGFVISRGWGPRFESASNEATTRQRLARSLTVWNQFVVRRSFRLLPALWLCLSLELLVEFLQTGKTPAVFGNELLSIALGVHNFFLIHQHGHVNFVPMWSLAVEEQFYLFFAVFLMIVPSLRIKRLTLITTSLFVGFILRPWLLRKSGHFQIWPDRTTTLFCLDALLIGCGIHFLSTATRDFLKRQDRFRPSIVRSLLFPALILSMLAISNRFIFAPHWLKMECIVLICSFCVLLATLETRWIACPKILEPSLDWIGRRSYLIYLALQPVSSLSKSIFGNLMTSAAAMHSFFGLCIGGGCILAGFLLLISSVETCSTFIEQPLMRLGRSLERRWFPEPAQDGHPQKEAA